MIKKIKQFNQKEKGATLIVVFIFALIAIAIILALSTWFAVLLQSSRQLFIKEQSFHLAESGIEYYRWHLAHNPTDYYDGEGSESTGPYVHEVKDINDNLIGQFSLEIIPPSAGSSIVEIISTGETVDYPNIKKTIKVSLAKPSFAKFAFVSDSDMRFGEGTEVYGPIHSNGGIRFDGLAHNLITSARDIYDDPDHSGNYEYGVHTHKEPIDPLPPESLPVRNDVFLAGRQVAVPAVDFDGIITDLSNLKNLAQTAEGLYFSASGNLGYLMQLKTNDTFDLYKVTSLASVPDSSCQNTAGQDNWGTWSVANTTFVDNYDFPANGVIFFEDDLWVEGEIDKARITIAAGQFPDLASNRKSIIINNDLSYTNYDGQDVISLIAQKDINIGLFADNNLKIDAALIAQNGRVGRYYYPASWTFWWWTYPGCEPYDTLENLDLYGMIGTKNRYGFAYTDGTGYQNRNITYDGNLLYNPPPYFPLTSDYYEIIKWEEI